MLSLGLGKAWGASRSSQHFGSASELGSASTWLGGTGQGTALVTVRPSNLVPGTQSRFLTEQWPFSFASAVRRLASRGTSRSAKARREEDNAGIFCGIGSLCLSVSVSVSLSFSCSFLFSPFSFSSSSSLCFSFSFCFCIFLFLFPLFSFPASLFSFSSSL